MSEFQKNSAFHPEWGDRGHHESDAEVEARRTARKHALALDSLSPHPTKRTGTTEVYTESLERWHEELTSLIGVGRVAGVSTDELETVRNEIYSYLRG